MYCENFILPRNSLVFYENKTWSPNRFIFILYSHLLILVPIIITLFVTLVLVFARVRWNIYRI